MNLARDVLVILPELVLVGAALLLLLLISVIRRRIPRPIASITILGLVMAAATAVLLRVFYSDGSLIHGFAGDPLREEMTSLLVLDDFAIFFHVVISVGALLCVALALEYLERENLTARFGEFCILLLLSAVGGMVLVSASDLVTIFLGIEILSLSLYVLTGYAAVRSHPIEAAVKYLILGALASGFLIYGIAFVYGATGVTNLTGIASSIRTGQVTEHAFLTVGLVLILVGLGFKIALVPFHQWAPDVYDGALTPVSAFMTTVPKIAAVAALFRLLHDAFPTMSVDWGSALVVLAVLTMTIGNIAAVGQRTVKRMLAYSSVAHAGYMLVGLLAIRHVSASSDAASALLFYGLAYTLMTIGAFGVVGLLDKRDGVPVTLEECSGLAVRHPWLALSTLVFMISLTGIPLTIGFVGKMMLFKAAVHAGLIGLVVVALLNSVVSAFYYLRVVVQMWMRPASEVTARPSNSLIAKMTLGVCAGLVLLLGMAPELVLNFCESAARDFAEGASVGSKVWFVGR